MNNNFNEIEIFKNFLTRYNPNIQKTNGLKINNDIRMIESNHPREEVVTLVFMYDKPETKTKKQKAVYPFLCDI